LTPLRTVNGCLPPSEHILDSSRHKITKVTPYSVIKFLMSRGLIQLDSKYLLVINKNIK
jgi:hypothetical protein